ncbi:MAG TPA: DNA recombination protein RmuC [Terriglobales bacterium]|nr:DNA recombination protein RmuC [Terriglobales bacterium]
MGQAAIILVSIICGVGIGVFIGRLLASDRLRKDFETKLSDAERRTATAEAAVPELRTQFSRKDAESKQLQERLEAELKARSIAETALGEERKRLEEQRALLSEAQDKLRDAFQAVAAQALSSNNESFLQLAKSTLEKYQTEAKKELEARHTAVATLVDPIKESLAKVDTQLQELEKSRSQAYGTLTEQVKSLIGSQQKLEAETGKLVTALRAPNVRGRWGEIQLRRVVEIANMIPYCDFEEQVSVSTSDGRLRPDLIVKLPGGKNVVVDAKAPLQAYLNALEAQDEDHRKGHLLAHARQIREHMKKLSSKAYWEQFQPTPEFVVMFLPGETFFSAALEQDATLIEDGVMQKVIPASPTTLIALLRAVAYGWTQEKLARNALEISNLGKELYERLRAMGNHMEAVGKGLDRAVESYNRAVGSMESRVMVSARKFAELGPAVTEEIAELQPVEKTTRTLELFDSTEELAASAGAE